jgi:DNA-directed RNA polymerase subunit RPC12/RpoP
MIHYICQECEDQGDLPDDTKVTYCGICAGDTGQDAILIFSEVADSWQCSACKYKWQDNGFELPTECPKCGNHNMVQVVEV